MKKTIIRRTVVPQTLTALAGLHPILQRIYATRGIQSPQEIEHDFEYLLPYQDLLGIQQAVAYLANAIKVQQRILIVGDFDADGATSTAVAVSALRAFGAQHVDFLVPNRFEHGYGLSPELVTLALANKPDVIVTVDNGIASHSGVAAAKAHGIKVIITDHHLPGSELPLADAIVNPCQFGDSFASKSLAGVGVIFYVMLALRNELRQQSWFEQYAIPIPNMAQLLDLVALGTVADLVPLDRNNRILVQQGLRRIRANKARPGIQALFAIAGRDARRVTTNDLGYVIAPRLNAAGRLTDMALGIKCLLSEDYNAALDIARQLSALNEERRLIEQDMQQQAFAELTKWQTAKGDKETLPVGICLFDENWHQGVIGLLASRLKDYLHRPVIAFAPANAEELKGSARSVPGLHIRDALAAIASQYPDLIGRFGGHAMAAGLTLLRANYPLFSEVFATEVAKHLDASCLQGQIYSDGELMAADFCLELADCLRNAGPWGQAFPEPVFDGRFRIVQQRIVGNKHLKLTLEFENSAQPLEGIAFNVDLEVWPNHRLEYVHATYKLDINEYLGRRSLQLIIEQLESA